MAGKRHNFANKTEFVTVSIANGAQLSSALNCGGMSLVGIVMPAAFTGTAITFLGSADNSTFVDVYNTAGTQISATVGTSQYVALSPSDLTSIQYLKLKSGSAEGAARTITCVLRAIS